MVENVEAFDAVLAPAIRLGRNGVDLFEVDAPCPQRRRPFLWLRLRTRWAEDAAVPAQMLRLRSAQVLPYRTRRARQIRLLLL